MRRLSLQASTRDHVYPQIPWKTQTYYIKGHKGEVDIAYVQGGTFHPIEVKWTSQIRPEELKQIMVYKNGLILGRARVASKIEHVPCVPLLQYLLKC